MNLIFEGIDNSGKSTLIQAVKEYLFHNYRHELKVQVSEGPPKYIGEQNVRMIRYLKMDNMIFDRHPAISQPIYGSMRTHADIISQDLIDQFYKTRPLLIYCDPRDRGMTRHVRRDEVDTDEHIQAVEQTYTRLLWLYRGWAIDKAHFLYRIGDDVDQLLQAIGAIYDRSVRLFPYR